MMMMGSCCALWALAALMPLLFQLLGCVSTAFPVKACIRARSWLVVLLLFFNVCRIGEASHPGPATDSSNFVLGVMNPSGLRCKAPYVAAHLAYGDLWAVSETHLSSKDVAGFNAGLRFAGSPFCPFLGGHPVMPSATGAGCWKGVGVLSKVPVRHVPTSWPVEIQHSSRAMVFTSLIDNVWLTGGVVYGEPDSHYYPSRLQHNEALLRAVTDSVVFLSSGPRFVAGDWNVASGELPVFGVLEGLGFKDLQDIAAERWGIPPQPTCKARTRQDFCYISPELQHLLIQVDVINDVWPDHAMLLGRFHRLGEASKNDVWRTPGPFPWPKHWEVPPDCWHSDRSAVDDRYRNLWQTIENHASQALPFHVSKQMVGRAHTVRTTQVRQGQVCHVRVGRTGDFQPQFHGCSVRHAQWIRQVRRLQAFVRSSGGSVHSLVYRQHVWAAILHAPGFDGGFSHWWSNCAHKVHGSPELLPWFPPAESIAVPIFETVAIHVRLLEKQLMSTSRQYARLRRARNPNLIFRDIKGPSSHGVDFLIRPLQSNVTEVRADECSVLVDPPQPWASDRPVLAHGLPLNIIHVEEDCLWLQSIEGVQVGHCVSQLQCTGTKTDLEKAFAEAWKARWDRHAHVPEDRWVTILSFARAFLPRHQLDWPQLTPDVLGQIIASKKSSSACGLDGVSIQDLKSMPPAALSNFCDMYSTAEQTGQWPSQLLMGKVVCLAKVEQPSSVLDYRPITILGMLYRLWGSYHARRAIRLLDPFLPDTLYGSRMARFAGQVWSQLLWAVEDATAKNVALSGLIADLQKAFNHLPRLVVFEAAALLGIPMNVLTAWAGALSCLGRRFQIGSNLSRPVYSVTGMPEGDGLSCLGMLIVDILFHQWHRHFFPLCEPVSYVDDWTILTTAPDRMQEVFACLQRFTDAMDLLLDSRKTFAWSTSPPGRKALVAQGFKVETSCRVSGCSRADNAETHQFYPDGKGSVSAGDLAPTPVGVGSL